MILKAKIVLFSTCFAAAALVGFTGNELFSAKVRENQAASKAQEVLSEQCVLTPDGRTLRTVDITFFMRDYPVPVRAYNDKQTGQEYIAGPVFTIDGRKVERFWTKNIKLVECPA